jgi:hypothetical protein
MSLRAAAEVIECAVLLQRMSPVPTRNGYIEASARRPLWGFEG